MSHQRFSEPNRWGQRFPLNENGQLYPQDYIQYHYGPPHAWNQPLPVNPQPYPPSPPPPHPLNQQQATPVPTLAPPFPAQPARPSPPPLPGSQNIPAGQSVANPAVPVGGVGVGRFFVLVPRNQGGQASQSRLEFQPGTSPSTFLDRVCTEMGVEKASAKLAYKLPNDTQKVEPTRLADEDAIRAMIQKMEEVAGRARSVVPELRIINLAMTGKRKKNDSEDKENEVAMISEDVLEKSKKLKARYKCALHSQNGRWCFIVTSPDGSKVEHIELDTVKMAYWAQAWSLGKASLFEPPHAEGFDFAIKKARKSRAAGMAGSSAATSQPLGERNTVETVSHTPEEIPDSDDDLPLAYPPIETILNRLQEVMPAANYPRFKTTMEEHGIHYANNIEGLDRSFWVDQVGMPAGAVGPFLEYATKQVRKVQKQKKHRA